MKNILIFMSQLSIGGVERSLVSLLNSLDDKKYHVRLMLLSDTPDDLRAYVPEQVEVVPFPQAFRFLYIPRGEVLASFKCALGKNLNAFRLACYLLRGLVIHNMGAARQGLLAAALHTMPDIEGDYDAAIDYTGNFKTVLLRKVKAKRKISWVHGDYRILDRDEKIDQIEYGQLDYVVTVSKTCRDVFADVYPEYAEKCHVMPNITSKAFIRRLADEEPKAELAQDVPFVLSVTRLDPDKGLSIAIEACALLKARGERFRWYVLGEGPERGAVEKLIAEKSLKDDFVLLGAHPNPYPYMKKAAAIVHCSLSEGRSVAMDEAMLLEKPILLTNYPTAKDQIENGVTGLICDIKPESVADGLQKLMRDGQLRATLSHNLGRFSLPVEASLALFDRLTDAEKGDTV